jgi:aspartate/methionine/tyrosine aminotransferase
MFSRRVPADLRPNRLSAAFAAARAAGRPLLDLTLANPTRAGLAYPPDLLRGLSDPGALAYRPEPFGEIAARAALARTLSQRGWTIDAGRVFLTASTSEAYALIFKLLCDPGDEVLVPRPSYPLFEHLTALDNVVAVPYRLDYHGTWAIDRVSLEEGLGSRTRAILLVSPNNPTGSVHRHDDARWVEALAAARGLAVVSDEVFGDYLLEPATDARVSLLDRAGDEAERPLGFVLGGLSKSAGLPQLKLAWTVIDGPAGLVADAVRRLEVICDTYLSVGTPVQRALPALIERTSDLRRDIHARVRGNLLQLRAGLTGAPACDVPRVEGGWSAVVRVPAIVTEEDMVLRLLDHHGVMVHPGFFFDFSAEAFLVVSLLPAPETFGHGVEAVASTVHGLLPR